MENFKPLFIRNNALPGEGFNSARAGIYLEMTELTNNIEDMYIEAHTDDHVTIRTGSETMYHLYNNASASFSGNAERVAIHIYECNASLWQDFLGREYLLPTINMNIQCSSDEVSIAGTNELSSDPEYSWVYPPSYARAFYINSGTTTASGNPFQFINATNVAPFRGTISPTYDDVFNTIAVHLKTNVPVFDNYAAMIEYLENGSRIEDALNYAGADIDNIASYYWITNAGYVADSEGNKTAWESSAPDLLNIRLETGKKIAGYVNQFAQPNVIFIRTDSEVIMYKTSDAYSPEPWHKSVGMPFNSAWLPERTQEIGSLLYVGMTQTNIPIFDSNEKVNQYFNDEIGRDEAIMGNTNSVPPAIATGDEVTPGDIEEANIRSVLCRTYRMNSGSVSEFGNGLYDPTNYDDILAGLELFGERPIEAVLDAYYTPIDVSDFVNEATQSYIQLGSYHLELSNPINYVTYNQGKKVMFNEYIQPLYNDFRDYEYVKYNLYLPYVGIFTLENALVVGKTLKCICTYDLKGHTLKYYLFSNGKLFDMKEASLGVSFPIVATDSAGKAQQNIQAGLSMTNALTGAVTSVAGKGLINPVGIASSVLSGVIATNQRPERMIKGNLSSASATRDISYPYLMIETQNSIYPANLRSQYGTPCSKISRIGNESGYCEVMDARLQSLAPKSHQDAILQIMKNGFII